MARRLKCAIELVSDIGSKAFDLQHHSDEEIAEAVKLLRDVNGPMFDWLVKALEAPPAEAASDPHADSTGKLSTREKGSSSS